MTKKFRPTKEQLHQWYVVEGQTAKEISERCGYTRRSVNRLIVEMDIPSRSSAEHHQRKRGPTILDDPEELRRLYVDQELSCKMIARIIGGGVGHKAVARHLRKHGIHVNTQSEAHRTLRALKENFLWKGGISKRKKDRAPGFTQGLKKSIRTRDGNRCQICGRKRGILKDLSVHHIDLDKNNHKPENLITLCGSCHRRVHAETLQDQR